MLVELPLVAATPALRGATARNRHIHGRLIVSAAVFGECAIGFARPFTHRDR